jgi:flagellar hook-associated protein 2
MPTITSAGVGSNLDVIGLVTQLMAIERQPLTKLAAKEAGFQAKISAFGTLKSALSEFQNAARALGSAEKLSPLKSNVADTAIMTASASGTAVAGNYDVEVKQLAQAQKLVSNGSYAATTSEVGTGKLTITLGSYDGGGAFTADSAKTAVDVTIDATNNTLGGLRDAINKANAGVTASIINDGSGNYLSLTSKTTGAKSAMKIDAVPTDPLASPSLATLAYNGPSSTGVRQNAPAADAIIIVDSVQITKPSNTITDAIQGVTLNLAKTTATGVTTKLTLDRDTSSVRTAIEAFVKAYNGAAKNMADATAFDASTGKAAVLNGDSTVRGIQAQLRSIMGGMVTGAPAGAASLPDIGITTQRDGSLAIDSAKLSAALNDPNKDMAALFAGVGTNKGVAAKIDFEVGRILSPVGALPSHTKTFTESIKDIDKQRAALNVRLAATEKRYRDQFSALDTTIASMTSTSNYLMQQLASLANL